MADTTGVTNHEREGADGDTEQRRITTRGKRERDSEREREREREREGERGREGGSSAAVAAWPEKAACCRIRGSHSRADVSTQQLQQQCIVMSTCTVDLHDIVYVPSTMHACGQSCHVWSPHVSNRRRCKQRRSETASS